MNEKIKETLDELLSAESICAPLKAAAEKAKEAAGTASEKLATAELVAELKISLPCQKSQSKNETIRGLFQKTGIFQY